MKKYSVLLLLGLIGVSGYVYAMEEGAREEVVIELARGQEITLSKDEFAELKGIIDPDIKSLLEEGAPYSLFSVDKAGLEFIIKNAESIKSNDLNALKALFKELYDANNGGLFSSVLGASAYLVIEPILTAAPDFINKNSGAMIKEKPDFLKAIIATQKQHKRVPFFDKERTLIIAIKSSQEEIVKQLIEANVNLDAQDNYGNTALIVANSFWYRSPAIIKLLIKAGADLNVQNKKGATALIEATNLNIIEGIKRLLDAGANPNIQDKKGTTALIIAAAMGRVETVKLLLKAGADLNIQDTNGDTALLRALKDGVKVTSKMLIKAGADLTKRDKAGRPALFIAAKIGHKDIVEALVKAKADLTILYDDDSVLDAAATGPYRKIYPFDYKAKYADDRKEVITFLADIGVDLNKQDSSGRTALMKAAMMDGNDKVIKALIDAGADLTLQDKDGEFGQTALDFAVYSGSVANIIALTEAGAKFDEDSRKSAIANAALRKRAGVPGDWDAVIRFLKEYVPVKNNR